LLPEWTIGDGIPLRRDMNVDRDSDSDVAVRTLRVEVAEAPVNALARCAALLHARRVDVVAVDAETALGPQPSCVLHVRFRAATRRADHLVGLFVAMPSVTKVVRHEVAAHASARRNRLDTSLPTRYVPWVTPLPPRQSVV
jgi:hypothetical protein